MLGKIIGGGGGGGAAGDQEGDSKKTRATFNLFPLRSTLMFTSSQREIIVIEDTALYGCRRIWVPRPLFANSADTVSSSFPFPLLFFLSVEQVYSMFGYAR